ncbi:MAG TPA: guanitoxin biosynthesis heme-dependent pre-guanitoxin N-hydroxylase GntA [Gemmatimonadaceae bacterium]|nr:guanitoxin biosynthesis heme-dependent pre-guanitoxin N-hydroxylase GntA [Gemmatimonadaceae bacterium]
MNVISVESEFRSFVEEPTFPCLAGKGLVRQRGYTLGVYGQLGSEATTAQLASDLGSFSEKAQLDGPAFAAFVAIFRGRPPATESLFEEALWTQLQRLHENDGSNEWDPSVSSNPEDPKFGFSFAERAFFVVGLHPGSSRLSRRFSRAALVFNPHAQFDRLRQEGRFERLKFAIRERDLELQQEPNASLADFGARSEARQYSGKESEAAWKCPFHPRPT